MRRRSPVSSRQSRGRPQVDDEAVAHISANCRGIGGYARAILCAFHDLLAVVGDLGICATGNTVDVAIQTLRKRAPRYTAVLIEQFGKKVGAGSSGDEAREIELRAIQLGMIIMQDVRTQVGTLLVPRGFEVTQLFLERIGNFGPELLSESIRVLVPAAKAAGSA